MSVINDAQTNRVCAFSITITSYFCLNTAQYIVEYSDVDSGIIIKHYFIDLLLNLMQHKDTSQQAVLIIYLICILSFNSLFHL